MAQAIPAAHWLAVRHPGHEMVGRNFADRHNFAGYWTLANDYDVNHSHESSLVICDLRANGACQMDGAAHVTCNGKLFGETSISWRGQFNWDSDSIADPRDPMRRGQLHVSDEQGPGFLAHQFLFGATSAPSADDEAAGIFASENVLPKRAIVGCIAAEGTTVTRIGPEGENRSLYPPIYPASSIKPWSICLMRAAAVLCGLRRTQSSIFARRVPLSVGLGRVQTGMRVSSSLQLAFSTTSAVVVCRS